MNSPHIKCADGFTMSVQASSLHYSSPRNDVGPWDEVEVGKISQIEPILWQYAEENGNWLETVYPFVPIKVVVAVIEAHGGFQE